ncbi:MAG: RNA polymerase sigma-70 factor [Cytophagales bacterium]|nr:RNA polymerase sigma-70 factor [Cytophagales bacterium]MDW8384331.1 RNA polymerase sigma-70 factor [Flammeovirgaceae bacterium]
METLQPITDEELFKRIKNGDSQAFEYLVKWLYKPMFQLIYSMVKEKEYAEELTQDVFANFWAKREQIQITGSLKSYLYRASRNHTLNFLKRKKFEQNYQRRVAKEMVLYKEETEDNFFFRNLQTKIEEAIESLPDSSREIFKMSRYADMTYKEIAETLEIPVRTVHYQIGLALKELREKLRGHVRNEKWLE